jgi:hypothetical protein
MGLDMYLHAKKYFNKVDWDKTHSLSEGYAVYDKFNEIMKATGMEDIATDIYGTSVEVTCAYWRKSNQIHAWFVKHVQNGQDDCGNYYVSHEKLKELRETCRQALFNRDPNLLPPQEGFFFGGTDIDEWYWKDIKATIKKIDRVLALPEMSELSFYYNSSW